MQIKISDISSAFYNNKITISTDEDINRTFSQSVHSMSFRACLDQLLIAIRSFTRLCDQSRSQARLIAIMKLMAKLGIIYATAYHASPCITALDCLRVLECQLSLPPQSAYYYIQTRQGEGEVAISKTVAAAAGALGLSKVSAGCH